MMLCFDVLIQFLGTLAISEGFVRMNFEEIRSTHCRGYHGKEWQQVFFITTGGNALQQYDEFKKWRSTRVYTGSIA